MATSSTRKFPLEKASDPFKIARAIALKVSESLIFMTTGWHGEGLPPGKDKMSDEFVNGLIAWQIKKLFDRDYLVDEEGRVKFVTRELVADVRMALVALAIDGEPEER